MLWRNLSKNLISLGVWILTFWGHFRSLDVYENLHLKKFIINANISTRHKNVWQGYLSWKTTDYLNCAFFNPFALTFQVLRKPNWVWLHILPSTLSAFLSGKWVWQIKWTNLPFVLKQLLLWLVLPCLFFSCWIFGKSFARNWQALESRTYFFHFKFLLYLNRVGWFQSPQKISYI